MGHCHLIWTISWNGSIKKEGRKHRSTLDLDWLHLLRSVLVEWVCKTGSLMCQCMKHTVANPFRFSSARVPGQVLPLLYWLAGLQVHICRNFGTPEGFSFSVAVGCVPTSLRLPNITCLRDSQTNPKSSGCLAWEFTKHCASETAKRRKKKSTLKIHLNRIQLYIKIPSFWNSIACHSFVRPPP